MTRALAATLFAALVLIPAAGTHGIKEGGTFRVAAAVGSFDTIDPALVNFPSEVSLLRPACGSLMEYPSKPLPAGVHLRPELAEAYPAVSRDGRTHTFTIRRDARFSDGSRVTARAFVRAIERFLDPAMRTAGASQVAADLVGGEDVLAGKTKTPSGVSAKGRVLTLRLTRRIPDFLSFVQQPALCAVPPSLPADPEGAKAPLHSAAPYYVKEYVPGDRLLLERNRFYKGPRPHHVTRFDADLTMNENAIVDEIASGKLDWGWATGTLRTRAAELKQRYGENTSQGQFYVQPANGLRMFVLNTGRPLFRKNPLLRQAVNFAVNRRELTREIGALVGTPTDQYLSPGMPGFKNEQLYPLTGPDVKKARQLAKGHTRKGKAVLYVPANPAGVAQAQLITRDLKRIDIEVEVETFPGTLIFEKLRTDRQGFDIGFFGFPDLPADPSWIAGIFDGRTIGEADNQNFSYFNSPKYNRLLDEAARLTGNERYGAYGALDVQLSRDAAPAVPIANLNALTFVSARTGCVVVNPFLDLAAVCLK